MKDTIHTIRRSSRRFLSGTLLSRLTGMLRDISMAYVFGTQPSIAAFMVAFRFAHLLRRLFGEGALQSAFIPEFETLRHQNEQRAFIFFRDLTVILTVFLIFLIVSSCIVLTAFLWWGDLSPDNQEIVYLTILMLPSLLFICLFGLNTSLLQCEKNYFISSVAPVAFNSVWIVSIFCLKNTPAKSAMPWLALSVVIACFCQWFLTVPQTWHHLKKIFSSLKLSFYEFSPDLCQLSKPFTLGILGVAASQINNAVDSVFARFAEPEGPALLWYALRIQQLPLALFGIAIAGAVLPPLARALKNQQREDYQLFLYDALYRTWIFMLPMTAALLIMGDSSVNALYGRGDFEPQSVIKTTYCLWAYSIGLIPSALVLVLAPVYYTQSNYTFPAIASFIAMLLNLLLNSLFIIIFHWGAVSVAIATSISAWLNLVLLGGKLIKSGTSLVSWSLLKQTMPINLATIVACYGTYKMRIFFQEMSFFAYDILSSSIYIQFSTLVYQGCVFGSLLFVCYSIFYLSRFLSSFIFLKRLKN